MPVEAPLGTAARNKAVPVHRSTSTVGFPRESKISRARTAMMVLESGAASAPAAGAATLVWFLTASAAALISSRLPKYLPNFSGAMAASLAIGFRSASRVYMRGRPVGISKPVMSSSEIPSRNFKMARMELPCAATKTVFPLFSSGAIVDSQKGITRAIVSLRHSVLGMSALSNAAYFFSLAGLYSLSSSIGGGGMSKLLRQIWTWSAPCFFTVSFLSSPVSPPYMRSFKRQLLVTGTKS
mmetsp:Transcript_38787/g.89728  ORF Transcript_38787/g.89728 Transcript_38787/m.89728 type:complete len:240 (+) Transcript_38787:1388-2107(+)